MSGSAWYDGIVNLVVTVAVIALVFWALIGLIKRIGGR